jgi:hypothetical protein
LDRSEVPLKFLFWPAFPDAVCFRDAIGAEIFRRFFLMLAMPTFFFWFGIIRGVRLVAVR